MSELQKLEKRLAQVRALLLDIPKTVYGLPIYRAAKFVWQLQNREEFLAAEIKGLRG